MTKIIHYILHFLLIPFMFYSAEGGTAADRAYDMGDHPDFAHAMQIETRSIDGVPVVFHYQDIRPDFVDHSPNPHRARKSLDGDWFFRFDPKHVGQSDHWEHTPTGEPWTSVTVPHCWDMMPGGQFWNWQDRTPNNPPLYDGAAWYRKTFVCQPDANRRYRLEFLGVQQRARIFLNGKLLALHEGGGQPFSIDVSKHLQSGGNTLAVQVIRVNNFRPKEESKGFHELRPTHTQHPKAPDNWPYAGITRSVSLIEEPPLTIRKVQIAAKKQNVFATVCLSNHGTQDRQIQVQIDSDAIHKPEPHSLRIKAGEHRVIRFRADRTPKARDWAPNQPQLYTLHAQLLENGEPIDQLNNSFGFSNFSVQKSHFALGRNPVFLKGVAFYEEHPKRGNALTDKDHEELFDLADDVGANFIRLHVGQRDITTYQLADQRGFLLCAEWGGFWYTENAMGAQTKDTYSAYQSQGRCAVWDLINHPSVVLWGIHNESHQFCPEYEEFVRCGRELVHRIDPLKRPITWAAWHPTKGQPKFKYADVVGFNEYRGVFDPFEELRPDLEKTIKNNPSKPLLIMENGAWAKPGNRGPVTQKNTEDWQEDILRRQYEVLTDYTPPLAGYTYWLLVDYRSRKPYTGRKDADGWSRMGLYGSDRAPKLARDLYKKLSWPTPKP